MYTTLYKDIPLGTEIIHRNTYAVLSIAGDGAFEPDEEIAVIDGVYTYRD